MDGLKNCGRNGRNRDGDLQPFEKDPGGRKGKGKGEKQMILFLAGILIGFIIGSLFALLAISLCIAAGVDRKADDIEQERFLKEKKK